LSREADTCRSVQLAARDGKAKGVPSLTLQARKCNQFESVIPCRRVRTRNGPPRQHQWRMVAFSFSILTSTTHSALLPAHRSLARSRCSSISWVVIRRDLPRTLGVIATSLGLRNSGWQPNEDAVGQHGLVIFDEGIVLENVKRWLDRMGERGILPSQQDSGFVKDRIGKTPFPPCRFQRIPPFFSLGSNLPHRPSAQARKNTILGCATGKYGCLRAQVFAPPALNTLLGR
jgi:hypothetical protein